MKNFFDFIDMDERNDEKIEEVICSDIAIIGVAVKIPKSDNLSALWKNLLNSEVFCNEVSDKRKEDIITYLSDIKEDEKVSFIEGAFLDEIDGFDYSYFGYSHMEANLMNPEQRIFLQNTKKCFDDAGYSSKMIDGSRMGVYVAGIGDNESYQYKQMIEHTVPELQPIAAVGNIASSIAGRVSYTYNLTGPSMNIDTACSSSITALHVASQNLTSGEVDMALVGAVRVNILPLRDENKKIGAESEDDRNMTFDKNASGYGTGEGCITLLLKRSVDAQKDKDNIYGIIKASQINQNGHSVGFTVPNYKAQADLICKACEKAGITPIDLSFIEAHGTATRHGDPIEINGICEAFKDYGSRKQICAITSIKANMGHLYEAAGLIGLVKALLMLKNRTILPQAGFSIPNGEIDFINSPVYVNTRLRKLVSDTLYCGISSFGLSGTNGHVILQNYEEEKEYKPSDNLEIFTLSANSKYSFEQLIKDYMKFISEQKELSLADFCYTINAGRDHSCYRVVSVVNSISDINCFLSDLLNKIWKKGFEEALEEYKRNDSSNYGKYQKECIEYLNGKDIEWGILYKGRQLHKISAPSYPFDEQRCWIPVKEAEKVYYSVKWFVKEQTVEEDNKNILVFADSPESIGIIRNKVSADNNVIFVYKGENCQKINSQEMSASYSASGINWINQELCGLEADIIIYVLDPHNSDVSKEEFEDFYNLTLHLRLNKRTDKIKFVVIGRDKNVIAEEDCGGNMNAALICGFCKVLWQEKADLKCHFIDISKNVDECTLHNEIVSDNRYFETAIRGGTVYYEALGIAKSMFSGSKIRVQGVYIITGGLGNAGIEIATAISEQNPVHLILVSKTKWEDHSRENKARIGKAINSMKANGSSVDTYSCDIRDEQSVKRLIDEVHQKFGKVNGIIHSAVRYNNKIIQAKPVDEYFDEMDIKMKGCLYLDKYTREDYFDFFIIFSSALSIVGEVGTSSYTASNNFVEKYAEYRRKEGAPFYCIRWSAWGESESVILNNLNHENIFNPFSNKEGRDIVIEVLRTGYADIIGGELNEKREFLDQLVNMPIGMDEHIHRKIEQTRNAGNTEASSVVFESKVVQNFVKDTATAMDIVTDNDIEEKIFSAFCAVLGSNDIEADDNFFEIGGDSIMLRVLHKKVDELYPGHIQLVDLFEYSTVRKISEYLAGKGRKTNNVKIEERILNDTNDDIAIVGLAYQFPGCKNSNDLWKLISSGVDVCSEFPEARKKDIDLYVKKLGYDPASISYFLGSYLDRIDEFDYSFFNITPKDAAYMDPCQRIFLETGWLALENANLLADERTIRDIGVYVAYAANLKDSYQQMIIGMNNSEMNQSLVNNIPALIASRVSYALDLTGPSMMIDTTCSSSQVAIHTACVGLKNGDCHAALVGGIKLQMAPVNAPDILIGYESEDCRTRTFDANASGAGISEGVAAIVLKKLSQAESDKDHIYAVIKGSAINQDGASIGITAPNPKSQTEVIQKAWKSAGISADMLQYIEAHGTATSLGDPIEIKGLQGAFNDTNVGRQTCAIGTAKTNFGHMFECSGMLSVIKVIESFKHKVIPGEINFKYPNEQIDFINSPVFVNNRNRVWERKGYPRTAGINGFGISGTNSHLVIQEYEYGNIEVRKRPSRYLLFFSAKEKNSMLKLFLAYESFFTEAKEDMLLNISYTMNCFRPQLNCRTVAVAESKEKILEIIKAAIKEEGTDIILDEDNYMLYSQNMTERDNLYLEPECKDVDIFNLNKEKALALSNLYLAGKCKDPSWLYKNYDLYKVILPPYQFNNKRCWISAKNEPQAFVLKKSYDEEYVHTIKWERYLKELQIPEMEYVILLHDQSAIGTEIERHLVKQKIGYISLDLSDNIDFIRILKGIPNNTKIDIIQICEDKLPATDCRNIDWYINTSIMKLKTVLQAFDDLKLLNPVELTIAAPNAYKATGNEQQLDPLHSILFGYVKVVNQEYQNWYCRCVDFDEKADASEILKLCHNREYIEIALREHEVYIPVLAETEVKKARAHYLTRDGVYIITGGMDGIGLETALCMAKKEKIRLILIGRNDITKYKGDKIDSKISERLQKIKKIELLGSSVDIYQCDVTDTDRLTECINEVKAKYNKISGVVHSAGVVCPGLIRGQKREDIGSLIDLKVKATVLLDQLTDEYDLDFFLMFSTFITLTGEIGMSNYVCANAFLDAYADYRNLKKKNSYVINWGSWRDIGMSLRHGVNFDTFVKAIETEYGNLWIDKVLHGNESRTIVGRLNYDSEIFGQIIYMPVKLEEKLLRKCNFKKQHNGEVKFLIDPLKMHTLKSECTLESKAAQHLGAITDKDKVINDLAGIFNEVLGYSEIDPDMTFFDMGGDSLKIGRLTSLLSEKFRKNISINDIFQYSTINSLADYLCPDPQGEPKETESYSHSAAEPAAIDDKAVAIIGIGIKMAHTETLSDFKKIVFNREDVIGCLSKTREKDLLDYFECVDSSINTSVNLYRTDGRYEFIEAAFLEEIDEFDYKLFKITPKEAELMDPSQRKLLQVAWHAIEDAGYTEKIKGSNAGVFLGMATNAKDSYQRMVFESNNKDMQISMIGNAPAMAPSRVSYFFNLNGPAMIFDTGCSSGLVAINLAVNELRKGTCETAIACSARINLVPVANDMLNLGVESSDGRTHTWDECSDGAGIGEGVLAIMLKPLRTAVRDKDNIYAVIRGSAVNQDGHTIGITAPNPRSQEQVIRAAWKDAGLNIATADYIEAHGTGTRLGDPIEIEAINNVMCSTDKRNASCAISTVKSNYGHLFESAGLAGVLKGIVSLQEKKIPPTTNFNIPNSKIDFSGASLYINTRVRDWKHKGHPRRCGINSFGLSGTNSHIVMEEYVAENRDYKERLNNKVLAVSAMSESALWNLLLCYKNYIYDLSEEQLDDMCYTSLACRSHFEHRAAIVFNRKPELQDTLNKFIEYRRTDGLTNCYMGYAGRKLIGQNTIKETDIVYDVKDWDETVFADRDRTCYLAMAYVSGEAMDVERLFGNQFYKMHLPLYPFDKTRCWISFEKPRSVHDLTSHPYYDVHFVKTEKPESNTLQEKLFILLTDENIYASSSLRDIREIIASCLLISNWQENAGSLSEGNKKTLFNKIYDYFCSNINHIVLLIELHNETGSYDRFKLQLVSLVKIMQEFVCVISNIQTAGTANQNDGQAKLSIVTSHAYSVAEDEKNCENHAMIFSLMQSLQNELSNLTIQCIDVDGETDEGPFMQALSSDERSLFLRQGKYYQQEIGFKEYKVNEHEMIKRGGTYLFLGGLGGIGCEILKLFASVKDIKLIMIGRTKLPDKREWSQKNFRNNGKTASKIKALLAAEKEGTTIRYYTADIADERSMERILREVGDEFGDLNGIIQMAGINGALNFTECGRDQVEEHFASKIYGTVLLDKYFDLTKLDFFLAFSSVATVLNGAGQSIYAAANRCMESYLENLRRKGVKSKVVRWTTWKEVGMAAEKGFAFDTAFKTLETKDGMTYLSEILNSDMNEVLVGKINFYGGGLAILKRSRMKIAEEIRAFDHNKKAVKRKSGPVGDLELSGRDRESYTETERVLAEILCDSFKFSEINIFDNFFELGLDSILLPKFISSVNERTESQLAVTDVFEKSNISKLAEYIDSLKAESETAADEQAEEDDLSKENDIMQLIENIDEVLLTDDFMSDLIENIKMVKEKK